MLINVRQTAVIAQGWTLAMTAWLTAVSGQGQATRLVDSSVKDTVAWTWLYGAAVIAFGGVLRLLWAKWMWVRKFGRVNVSSPGNLVCTAADGGY